MFSLTSPVTGAAVTGLTSPTFTLVQSGSGPTPKSKQYYVSSLGGTQTGATVHSVSKPFTITFIPPNAVKPLPAANPITGVIKVIPENRYKLLTRVGGLPAANQNAIPARMSTVWEIPAGVETYDIASLKSAASLHIGALTQQINGIIDTLASGEA